MLGIELTDVMINGWGTRMWVAGFRAPCQMRLWHTHSDYRPPPEGWYVNKKDQYLLPIRKTKADRESQANADYKAIDNIPCVRKYVNGLPTEISLDDRDSGGTSYPVNYRRGETCIWAYCNGDPDRQPEKRANDQIDSDRWQRMPLSTLAILIEEKRERVAARE